MLSHRRIRRLITSEDLGVIGPQAVPFTFTYTLPEPAQILSVMWIYFADATVLVRVPDITVNEVTGTNRWAEWWGRQIQAAGETEVSWLCIGTQQVPFFGIQLQTSIPDDFWLVDGFTLRFFSRFGAGPGDMQSITFTLAQYE